MLSAVELILPDCRDGNAVVFLSEVQSNVQAI